MKLLQRLFNKQPKKIAIRRQRATQRKISQQLFWKSQVKSLGRYRQG
jgi:hypothetical protein